MPLSVKTLREGARPLADRLGDILKAQPDQGFTIREMSRALAPDAGTLELIELQAEIKVALVFLRAARVVEMAQHGGEEHFFWTGA